MLEEGTFAVVQHRSYWVPSFVIFKCKCQFFTSSKHSDLGKAKASSTVLLGQSDTYFELSQVIQAWHKKLKWGSSMKITVAFFEVMVNRIFFLYSVQDFCLPFHVSLRSDLCYRETCSPKLPSWAEPVPLAIGQSVKQFSAKIQANRKWRVIFGMI